MRTAKEILEEGATHIGWDVGDMLDMACAYIDRVNIAQGVSGSTFETFITRMAGVQKDLRNVED